MVGAGGSPDNKLSPYWNASKLETINDSGKSPCLQTSGCHRLNCICLLPRQMVITGNMLLLGE